MKPLFTTFGILFFFATSLLAQSPGNALNLDGVDDWITAPLPAVFSDIPNNDITIEAWVFPAGSAFQRIVYAQPSTTNFMSMGTNTGNVIYFYVIKNSTTYSIATTTSIQQNAWTHVACTWNANTNTVKCYFNGVLQPTVGGGSSSFGTSGILSIGARPGGAQYFNGNLDEIRIWSEERAACQILANKNASLTGTETNLQAYYKFDQGTAGGNNTGLVTLVDDAGNNDGTLTNFALTGNTGNWITSGADITLSGIQATSFVVIDTTICYGASYTLPDGNVLASVTSPVLDTVLSVNSAGCDSFTITNIDVSLCGNNALNFDGTDDWVNATLPSVFNNIPGNDITLEAWVSPSGSAFQRIVYAQPSTTNFMSMGTGNGNVIYFYVVKNGATYSLATTTSIQQNAWTHVACTWQANTNTVNCYFNGILQPSVGGGTSSTGTSGIFSIGTRPGGGAQHFNGSIDEVRVWSEARTACDLQANYRTSLYGNEPNLAAYYTFNYGVAGGNNAGVTILGDAVAGNNGSLTNFTLTGSTSNWIISGATLNSVGLQDADTVTESTFVCSGDAYTFPDGVTETSITAQVVHFSHLINGNGCDSVVVTTVDVNPTYNQTGSVTVCSGESYTFPDGTTQNNITAQVVYTSSLQTVNGCDSVIVTTVDVNPTYNQTGSAIVCSGESYTFPDGTTQNNITAQVVYTSNLQTVNGCDSVIVTTVDVNPTYNQTGSATVCSGESYTFPDGTTQNNITAQVVYTSNLQTVNGCDSVIVTTVDVNPTYNQTGSAIVCSGESYTFPDGTTQNNITAQVVYTSNLQTVNGCDSVIVTTVDVNPTYNQTGSATVCSGESYTFPDGTTQNNITAQVVYTSNLQTVNGCDSVIVTTVDVNPTYNQTGSAIVCSGESYTFPDGTTQNNITAQVVYTSNLQTVNGCDSVIVTTVDVNPTYNQTGSATVCSGESYTFPDGTTQSNITAQVVYTSNLQTVNGCDSVIVTTVDVNPTYNQTGSATVCSGESYTFPDGTTQNNITAQVVYTSNLQTVNGCDSVILTTLDVNPTYNQTGSATVCSGESYTFPDGTTQNNITAQVVYISNLQTVNGCDSVIVTTVDVNPTYNQTGSATVCSGESYTFPDGTTQNNITAQVVYTSNLQTVNGCDSIIITTVGITTVNTAVTQNNDTLTATGDTFQWLACTGNGYTVVNGATSATYVATATGSYAVVVTSNNCSDTSQCYEIILTGITPTDISFEFSLYPNPTSGQFVIQTNALYNDMIVEVSDVNGRVVTLQHYQNANRVTQFIDGAAGVYFVKVATNNGMGVFKMIKE